jgi:hypothetical protein
VLGVALGKGWRDPLPMRFFGAFDMRAALPVGRAAFTAWLLVVDGSGTEHNFTSSVGGRWRVGRGAVLRNNVYLGEAADLRVLRSERVRGWLLPGFNDSAWAAPVLANVSAIGQLQVGRVGCGTAGATAARLPAGRVRWGLQRPRFSPSVCSSSAPLLSESRPPWRPLTSRRPRVPRLARATRSRSRSTWRASSSCGTSSHQKAGTCRWCLQVWCRPI